MNFNSILLNVVYLDSIILPWDQHKIRYFAFFFFILSLWNLGYFMLSQRMGLCQFRRTTSQVSGSFPWPVSTVRNSTAPSVIIWRSVKCPWLKCSLWIVRKSWICILKQHQDAIAVQFPQLLLKPDVLLWKD